MAKFSVIEDGATLVSEFVCGDIDYVLEIDIFSRKDVLVSYKHEKNDDQIVGLKKSTVYRGCLYSKTHGLPLCKRGYTECLLVNFESALKNPKKELFYDTNETLIFDEKTGNRIY